jgi:hypothetical protein
LDTSYQSTRRQFPIDVTVSITWNLILYFIVIIILMTPAMSVHNL